MVRGQRLIALGIMLHLKRFANRRGAEVWQQIVDNPDEWKYEFLRLLDEADVSFCFNLTDVDVDLGLTRASAGMIGSCSTTDWELFTIWQHPSVWSRVEWWKDDSPADNPFEAAG